MKTELEVVRFDVTDVVTTSGGCKNPLAGPPVGNAGCTGDMG